MKCADSNNSIPMNTALAICFPRRLLSSPGIMKATPAVMKPSNPKLSPRTNVSWTNESSNANNGSILIGTSQSKSPCAAAAGDVISSNVATAVKMNCLQLFQVLSIGFLSVTRENFSRGEIGEGGGSPVV